MDAGRSSAVNLDSQFERDRGVDSLARADISSRIEQTLHVHVPLDAFSTVLTRRPGISHLAVVDLRLPARELHAPFRPHVRLSCSAATLTDARSDR
ncbi:acyl carrier protein [Paraburkholderia sp. WS6]|uniref:Acyl carrier protein n=1 Tax=Paraburkholderia madseniana TaxID=2599607 RepID=A0AAP5EM74_9BURK|nr:acyl carrier protein [Paraburkholderia sp. WS6]MCX4145125.1 acyl carrier protein [Paraburkholderia madseniana]MDN7148076.1 acyl carrier protein [Paraburkholderia sp. WS6]MDQ6406956.1 acyl carrier protein [Paraburkholderia madseniana]